MISLKLTFRNDHVASSLTYTNYWQLVAAYSTVFCHQVFIIVGIFLMIKPRLYHSLRKKLAREDSHSKQRALGSYSAVDTYYLEYNFSITTW
jgi:hypothetical protein